jgi:glycerophosphoryl diester phosphodiesterase
MRLSSSISPPIGSLGSVGSMRRPLIALLALALLAAGCGNDTAGGGAGEDAGDAERAETASEEAPTEATSSSTSTTTTTTTTTTTLPPPPFPTPAASTLDGVLGLGRPVVIGHAGGDRSWPHSTMFAYREAAVAGADVLEMDVMLTGDGVLVIQHDATVDRTTETTGRVRDLTYDELQALDNAYWASSSWGDHDLPVEDYTRRGIRTGDREPPPGYTPDDFRVETFRNVAETFPDHVLDIEIKIPRDDNGDDDLEFAIEGARVLADEIEELGRTDSVVVVSFNDDVIAAFREFAPDVATSPGTSALTDWFLGGTELLASHRVLQIPPVFDGIDILRLPGFLDKAADENLAIWIWPNDASTQENPDFYESLLEFDIDGIIAGSPDLAVERYREIGAIP